MLSEIIPCLRKRRKICEYIYTHNKSQVIRLRVGAGSLIIHGESIGEIPVHEIPVVYREYDKNIIKNILQKKNSAHSGELCPCMLLQTLQAVELKA